MSFENLGGELSRDLLANYRETCGSPMRQHLRWVQAETNSETSACQGQKEEASSSPADYFSVDESTLRAHFIPRGYWDTAQTKSDFWNGHIREWQSGGLCQIVYCNQHGLAVCRFRYWATKARRQIDPLSMPNTVNRAVR